MYIKDYLPKGDAQTIYWVNNFILKVRDLGPALGVSDEERTRLEDYVQDVNNKLNSVQQTKQTYQSFVESKNAAMDLMRQLIRKMVNKLKLHDNYTIADGENLGIIPPSNAGIPGGMDNARPDFEATVLGDMIRLDWMKREFDGVVIESKRGAEISWTRMDKDFRSPFEDTRKNTVMAVPETRWYRMRYLIGEKEVGQWSDEVKIVCSLDSVT
jgi:hypothetical protein